ncbi:hypothetical protein [Marinobacterium rhizophilum]|uniref:TyrR-like helix-turn-helix domain-containing protein n=1 Tax=Marinobacterium rhizophilum TaxID=420402 RepID=A0ABY5HG37_9GAMM|nr:hypothetical protein [Marinobacterium rhizophilum]UTW10277.1 hypothetical protein KDW95_13285 [Marinobacterium rhizophilum]
MIERLVVTAPDTLIRTDSLPATLRAVDTQGQEADSDLKTLTARFEHKLVREAVERFGNTRAAAAHLKISQSSVVRRLQKSEPPQQ